MKKAPATKKVLGTLLMILLIPCLGYVVGCGDNDRNGPANNSTAYYPQAHNGFYQCMGPYYYSYQGFTQTINCYGSNCSGWWMINTQTGQRVYCQ